MTRKDLLALLAALILGPQLREEGKFEAPAPYEYDLAVDIAMKLLDAVDTRWRPN